MDSEFLCFARLRTNGSGANRTLDRQAVLLADTGVMGRYCCHWRRTAFFCYASSRYKVSVTGFSKKIIASSGPFNSPSIHHSELMVVNQDFRDW